MKSTVDNVGLSGFGAALPERFAPLASLELSSQVEVLTEAGFSGAYLAEDTHALAATVGRAALEHARTKPCEVGALFFAGALSDSHHRASEQRSNGVLDHFCYSASWLQEELELAGAGVCGIAQQGCAGMFAALRAARNLLLAEPDVNHVLCIGADALPPSSNREVMYNVISDAACAVVLSRGSSVRYRWRGYHQVSKGYYWDVPARQAEIIAAYFPTARAAIDMALRKAGVNADEIDLVVPTGVQASSWPILLRLCGIPEDRLYQPQHRFGHTIAADSFLLLKEAAKAGGIREGMKVLLFAYGFGSSWCALVLEVVREEQL